MTPPLLALSASRLAQAISAAKRFPGRAPALEFSGAFRPCVARVRFHPEKGLECIVEAELESELAEAVRALEVAHLEVTGLELEEVSRGDSWRHLRASGRGQASLW